MLTFSPDTLHDATTRIFVAAGADEDNGSIVMGCIRLPSRRFTVGLDPQEPIARLV